MKKTKKAETKKDKQADSAKKTAKRKEKKKKIEKEKIKEKAPAPYWEGIGRRKTAVARVRIFQGRAKKIIVNEKDYQEYFQLPEVSQLAVLPLKKLDLLNKIGVSVKVRGGGVTSQAGAMRHGLARALVKYNERYRPKLKRLGYLTRDPRMRERKKFGLKRARRAPQWSKR